MVKDILFLDQDDTLGDFDVDKTGLFPGVIDFIRQQHEAQRRLYVATNASEQVRSVLSEIYPFISDYFGSESIDSNVRYYLASDGAPRKIMHDFGHRFEVLGKEAMRKLDTEFKTLADRLRPLRDQGIENKETKTLQARIQEISDYQEVLIHRITHEPFDESSSYQNPHNKYRYIKDLFLAKRRIAPQGYQALRSAMVGNFSDISTVWSDPETPLIVVYDKITDDHWNYVSVMLDVLFGSSVKPFEVYDELFKASKKVNINALNHRKMVLPFEYEEDSIRKYSQQGILYLLCRGERDARVIIPQVTK